MNILINEYNSKNKYNYLKLLNSKKNYTAVFSISQNHLCCFVNLLPNF